MAQQSFAGMYFPKDGIGTKGTAILQQRNGIDEPITPVGIWELDTVTGLYLPPGESANPKKPRMDVSGSEVTINGSFPELRGLSTDTKPTEDVVLYSTFSEMDTGKDFWWDGTAWQEMI